MLEIVKCKSVKLGKEGVEKHSLGSVHQQTQTDVIRFSLTPRAVSWCFQPSQPQRIISGLRDFVSWRLKPRQPQWIISGLKETFIKRYMAESANKTEIRLEEQSEKTKSCLENFWKEIQLKGPIRQK